MTGTAGERACRGCGCTDRRACPGGCAWVLLDIEADTGVCSACAHRLRWHMPLMATVGWDPAGFAEAVEMIEGDELRELHAATTGVAPQRGAA
jgi:hypothetical protein